MRLSRDSLIVLGILVVITATYFVVIYRWQTSQLAELGARRAELSRRLTAEAGEASRAPQLMREIKTMRQRYRKDWDRRLPQRRELAAFLREISANLAEEELENQIIAPGDPSRSPLYNVLPINMKFEGNFLALAGFLKRVDGMTRLTRVEYLKIDPKPKTEKLQIALGMNIYFTEQ